MAETRGWKEIVSPALDKMIIDVVGGKHEGKWYTGYVDNPEAGHDAQFYIGVKHALIKFHTFVLNHLREIPRLEEQIKVLQDAQAETTVDPNHQRSSYAPD